MQGLIESTEAEEVFYSILDSNLHDFEEFCKTEQIETYPNQNPVESIMKLINKLSPFELLVMNKIINANRVLFYLPIYTMNVMKNKIYYQPPNFDMQQTFSQANSVTPLIFVLSAGSDPMLQI